MINPGKLVVILQAADDSIRHVSRAGLEQARAAGDLLASGSPISELHRAAAERYRAAKPKALAEANRRFEIIRPVLDGQVPRTSLDRTGERYLAAYKQAETEWGWGYIGVLPRSRPGNTRSRLEQASEELAQQVIAEVYEQPNAPSQLHTYGAYVARALAAVPQITPLGFDTFTRRIRSRATHASEVARHGSKAAYVSERWVSELSLAVPRYGDYPWQWLYHDHTLLDWVLVDSVGRRPLGRPWLSITMDGFSRRVLAFWLTFDPPSYRSLMMLFRFLVKRFGRLGEWHVVDGGKEFGSLYFESLLAAHDAHKVHRPAAKSRFASVIERVFGTTNTAFVHNVLGNTKATRQVRTLTPAVDPNTLAIWALASAARALAQWFFEIYDTSFHEALGGSPREIYADGMAIAGERPASLVPYDETFLIESLPTTAKGTAVNDKRGRGIRLNGLFYFDDALRDPRWAERELPAKWDPFDFRHGFAFTDHWVEVVTHSLLASGPISQREWQAGASELRARRRVGGRERIARATDVAAYLVEEEGGQELARQRAFDDEAAPLLALTDSGIFVTRQPSLALPATAALIDPTGKPVASDPEPPEAAPRRPAVLGRYG